MKACTYVMGPRRCAINRIIKEGKWLGLEDLIFGGLHHSVAVSGCPLSVDLSCVLGLQLPRQPLSRESVRLFIAKYIRNLIGLVPTRQLV